MTPPAYLESFRIMVDELLAHPLVEVTHLSPIPRFSKTGKRAWTEHRNKMARSLRGYTSDRALVDLITALHAVKIRWNLHDHPLTKKHPPKQFLHEVVEQPATACIALPYLGEFQHRPHENFVYFDFETDDDTVTIGNQTYPRGTFKRSIRLFDVFDNYYDVAYVTPPGGPDGLILGRSAHADYSSRIIDVDTYVRLLLATRGSIELRVAFFDGNYELPDQPPSLDTLLETLRERAAVAA